MTTSINAGAFEATGISGVSLAQGADVMGIRLAVPHPALGLYDDQTVLLALEKPEAYAPDLGYVRYTWQAPITPAGIRKVGGVPRSSTNSPTVFDFAPGEAARITLEWCFDGEVVRGRYTADAPLRVALLVNGCFAPARVDSATVTGCRLTQGDAALLLDLHGAVDAPQLVDSRRQVEQLWAGVPGITGQAMACYAVHLASDTPLHFAMRLQTAPGVSPAAIDQQLADGAAAYAAVRMHSTGICAGSAEAVAALAGYSRMYDPRRGHVQTSVNRSWSGPNSPGPVFGWDNFFDAYLAAWESPAFGREFLEHIVSVYAELGIAHGPTQRNLIIPTL